MFGNFTNVKITITILLIASSSLYAQDEQENKSKWRIEYNGGVPYNINLPLTIEQEGHPDINLTANFASEPFVPPIYWVFRVAKWKNDKAWEFEMIHQKLYLENPTPEIQYFSITHGFNMTFINRVFRIKLFNTDGFAARIGTGIVFAHAENMIREKEFDQTQSFGDLGYYITYPNINLGLSKEFKLTKFAYLNLEAKHNTSYGKVPIVDGHAKLWHSNFAFVLGAGIEF